MSSLFTEAGELNPSALAELVYGLTKELERAQERYSEDESDRDAEIILCNMSTCLRILGVTVRDV